MSSVLVSVIVPVYNAAQYINDCISSILSQTFEDFELILVNDGSTDNSPALCRIWADKDSRIRLIDKENGGVSSARNAGLESAKGRWITFIDSDDWVDVDYLSTLICSLNNSPRSVEWVTSGISYRYNNGDFEIETPDNPGIYLSDSDEGLLSIAAQKLVTSPVGKLYRAEIIDRFNLCFDKALSFGEDRDFNIRYLAKCSNCLITTYIGYNYRKDISSSLSTEIRGDILGGDLDYWEKLYSLFREKDFMSIEVRCYLINRLFNFVIDAMANKRLSAGQIKTVKSKINRRFVRENASLISGNALYRFLFKFGFIGLLNNLFSVVR